MTDKEKEAYNFFKKCNEKDLENFDYFSEPSKLQIKYIETVLNLIQTQQEEIEKKDRQIQVLMNRTKNLNKECQQHFDNMMDTIQENSEKDKIIDEMARMLVEVPNSVNDEPMTAVVKAMINRDLELNKRQVINYVRNKVEKENKDE